jgi:hypothetical protein
VLRALVLYIPWGEGRKFVLYYIKLFHSVGGEMDSGVRGLLEISSQHPDGTLWSCAGVRLAS